MSIYRSKVKCLLATFIFGFCTIFLLVFGISTLGAGIGIIPLLFFLLFLLGTIDFLRQSLKSTPLLTFNEEGIQDYSRPFNSGKFIRWTDCQEARVSSRHSVLTHIELYDGTKKWRKVDITLASTSRDECLQIVNNYLQMYGKKMYTGRDLFPI
ncbi:hypothetical protein SAMN05444392_11211 [Seinonella peptonophila]|uniref:Uncharacterized protein n=1 Tax=Seinonella peptonophila TaxID=112248 RepID=A0A1M5A4N8_9BACL|nr:STM3941 family protein [Seinonella peptonophila]SHF25231.1 hypothetical protein SAMN05444392_11211 [Seinonella peptonophila]